MKRVLLGLTLAFAALSSTGCNLLDNRQCNSCNGNLGCRPCKPGWQRGGTDYQRFLGQNGSYHGDTRASHHGSVAGSGGAGGQTAQVAYPYYTTRGPRDFLVDNPPTIGN